MSEQQREEKQSRASSFSHKAPAQAAASAKGMPPIASTLRAISATPPRMRYTLAYTGALSLQPSSASSKPLCLHAAQLGPANRQALERLAPKLLQALLHAEPPALLSYQEERG